MDASTISNGLAMHSTRCHEAGDVGKPYTVSTRKERSRELAQKRRTTYKSLMNDMADVLPFSKEVVSQIDYNSRLRLALCFIRMKKILGAEEDEEDPVPVKKRTGIIQDLVVESLDGFLMTCTGDGTIVFLSDTIHKHLGLFQSEHIGFSLYDLVHEDDHNEVKRSLTQAETRALAKLSSRGIVECSFFCRMKCSKSKLSNSATKSPGYKLVYISGQYKVQDAGSFLTGVVHPVSPPSILEVRMEGNMFVTHYTLDMRCTFFDGRLKGLMGFAKEDLVGHVPFEYHHHEDVGANVQCSKGLMERGEGLSGYYRYINKYGVHVWMQSRGIMMFDSRTGKPSYIVCMNYVISKEKGEEDLKLRRAIDTGHGPPGIMDSSRSYDPIPTSRDDALSVNPFEDSAPLLTPLHSPSVSPPESRASPDLLINHPGITTDIKSDSEAEDMGYSSSFSMSLQGSVISPLSVGSSLVSDDHCSNNSVFHGSPQSCHSPDLGVDNSPVANATPMNPSVLAALLSNNSQMHYGGGYPINNCPVLPTSGNQSIHPGYIPAKPRPSYHPSTNFSFGTTVFRPSVEFSASVLQHQPTTIQTMNNNLPVLTVEDIQYLTSSRT